MADSQRSQANRRESQNAVRHYPSTRYDSSVDRKDLASTPGKITSPEMVDSSQRSQSIQNNDLGIKTRLSPAKDTNLNTYHETYDGSGEQDSYGDAPLETHSFAVVHESTQFLRDGYDTPIPRSSMLSDCRHCPCPSAIPALEPTYPDASSSPKDLTVLDRINPLILCFVTVWAIICIFSFWRGKSALRTLVGIAPALLPSFMLWFYGDDIAHVELGFGDLLDGYLLCIVRYSSLVATGLLILDVSGVLALLGEFNRAIWCWWKGYGWRFGWGWTKRSNEDIGVRLVVERQLPWEQTYGPFI